MSTAVSKVRTKEIGIDKAARLYGVPKSTIRSRVVKKGQTIFRSGRTTLTMEEERKLEDWIIDMQQRGLPVTKAKLADSVEQFLNANPRSNVFTNNRPSLLCTLSFLW